MHQRKHSSRHTSNDGAQKGKGKGRRTDEETSTSYDTSSEYWCEFCTLHISNCRCPLNDDTTSLSSWQSPLAGTNNNIPIANQAYNDQNNVPWNASISSQTYGSSNTYGASTGQPLITNTWAGYPAATAQNETDNGSMAGFEINDQRQESTTSLKGDGGRERRLKANRNSQRKFRYNQMKIVEDLKEQVDVLKNKNQKLSKRVSSLDKGEMYHVSKMNSPGDGGNEEGLSVLVHAGTDQVEGYVMSWGDDSQ